MLVEAQVSSMKMRRAGSTRAARRTPPAAASGCPACPARPRARSFFARDPPPGKETPDRAVAHHDAAGGKRSAYLLERDVRRLVDKAQDQTSPGLDAA